MDNKKGGLDVAYNIQATVDAKNGLVIDQYVTNAPTDQGELSNAASRTKKILSAKELIVLADKGYYNGEDLEKCLDMSITPVVTRQNPPKRKGMNLHIILKQTVLLVHKIIFLQKSVVKMKNNSICKQISM